MRIPLQLNDSFSVLLVRIFIAIEKSAKGHSSLSPGKTPLNQWGQKHLKVSLELFKISESEFEMKLSILDGMKN